mmetsp:Transcript_44187/g.71014  ORF Transcript_44187/g.71014 Transcript_44187/m.71014 type:complete len:88 (-) Transcript_44187:534-797(-)
MSCNRRRCIRSARVCASVYPHTTHISTHVQIYSMRACHAIDGAASEDDAAGIASGTEVEGVAEDEEDKEEGEEREEGFFLDRRLWAI